MAKSNSLRLMKQSAVVLLGLVAPLVQGPSGHTDNLDERVLAAHNQARADMGVPPLKWSDRLAASAAQWSAHLAQTGEVDHSPQAFDEEEPVGENLFTGTRGRYEPEAMVGAWTDEKKMFHAGVFPNNSRTGSFEDVGHYTQVVWRGTRQLGCAVAANGRDDFLVCRYAEAGNVEGERPF